MLFLVHRLGYEVNEAGAFLLQGEASSQISTHCPHGLTSSIPMVCTLTYPRNVGLYLEYKWAGSIQTKVEWWVMREPQVRLYLWEVEIKHSIAGAKGIL